MNEKFASKAFVTLYRFLDNLYKKEQNDSLGTLLGDMNPDLFVNSISADPAVYEDFYDCAKECYESSRTSDARTAFLSSMKFLRMYHDEFGSELQDVIKAMDYSVYQIMFEIDQ